MKQELQDALFAKYPKIFQEKDLSEMQSCMHWGLEVGDGWYDIIDTLCHSLSWMYTTSVGIDEEDAKALGIKSYTQPIEGAVQYYFTIEKPQVVATQVKEKFGELRFYYRTEFNEQTQQLLERKKYPDLVEAINRYSSFIDGIVHYAEHASMRTCEVTGSPGVLHVRNGWQKVLNRDLVKQDSRWSGYKPFDHTSRDEA